MDTILISIIILAIIIFYTIGHFMKRYKHHHTLLHSEEEIPVFTELTAEEPKESKKHSKNKVLSHEKIKKLVRRKK